MGCKDDLKLYIYRLKLPGEKEEIRYSLSPDMICEPGEEELFPKDILVSGSLERIDHEQWFLFLGVSTQLSLRCCVCEKKFLHPIQSIEISHLIYFNDAKSGIFDCKDLIRQELLLESDNFQECDKNGCPERGNIIQFLKDRQKDKGNSPFDQL
ncbi:hypothetical protein JG731_04120 [Chlamydia gallinacea]|uniref:DUF177 domain-containing protein n=2 Tax=Chlamydia gallinacea TaxID=1457153 RepID=A0A173DY80_9CHLA|nr:hypothetical protein [Chlamydia gallinacea]ANG65879.1 hypothetical protein M787_000865 [Chlamydia gallinacea 08-1274/3]MBX6680529.1 hypothetical protein [Chlamydia gallinacea]MBX6687444.1 hypothetical protein [Chlamydia gallinacea]